MTSAGRLRWATDIHLDHLNVSEALAFAGDLFSGLTSDDCVVVTGDISSSTRLTNHLRIIDEASQQACDVPWCFVLGNHDYYGARIADVRADVCGFTMPAHPTGALELAVGSSRGPLRIQGWPVEATRCDWHRAWSVHPGN